MTEVHFLVICVFFYIRLLVSHLYFSYPGFLLCLPSAMGMLTKRKSAVLAAAPSTDANT